MRHRKFKIHHKILLLTVLMTMIVMTLTACNNNEYDTLKEKDGPINTNEEITLSSDQYETELSNGHFISGKDFPAGYYTITAVKFGGNVSSSNQLEGGINELMATEAYENILETDMFTQSMPNIYLPEGTTLSIDTLLIKITSESISNKTYSPRVEMPDASIILTAGEFKSGLDFPAGVYTLKIKSGYGTVDTTNPFDGGLIAMMGEDDPESNAYQYKYSNISLPKIQY